MKRKCRKQICLIFAILAVALALILGGCKPKNPVTPSGDPSGGETETLTAIDPTTVEPTTEAAVFDPS